MARVGGPIRTSGNFVVTGYMKKNRLIISTKYDFHLIGIVSAAREYKLVWSINRLLDFPLKKMDDINIEFSGNHQISISRFAFETEQVNLDLLKNRLNEKSSKKFQYLLEELKQFDFLLKFQDRTEQTDPNDLIKLLKASGEIDFATTLSIETIKAKDNLIF